MGIIAIIIAQLVLTAAAYIWHIEELYVVIPSVVFIIENVMFRRLLKNDPYQRKRLFYACQYGTARPYNPKRAAVPIVVFLLSCMFLLFKGYVVSALLAGVAAILHQLSYDTLVSVCNTGEVSQREFEEKLNKHKGDKQ